LIIMDWKEFLKPTVAKIILTILLLAISFFFIMPGSDVETF